MSLSAIVAKFEPRNTQNPRSGLASTAFDSVKLIDCHALADAVSAAQPASINDWIAAALARAPASVRPLTSMSLRKPSVARATMSESATSNLPSAFISILGSCAAMCACALVSLAVIDAAGARRANCVSCSASRGAAAGDGSLNENGHCAWLPVEKSVSAAIATVIVRHTRRRFCAVARDKNSGRDNIKDSVIHLRIMPTSC